MSARDQATAAVLARLAMACDGALLGVALAVVAAQTWVKYRFSSQALDQVRQAPSSRISDLRCLLSLESEEADDSSPSNEKIFVVRGVVREESKNDSALVSHGSGERAVVVQRTQTCLYNEWRGLFGWSVDLHALFARSRKEQHSYSCRSVPFALVESGIWPQTDIVHVNFDGLNHPLPLTTVYHQLLPVQAFQSSFLQALFGNGYPVAILDEEKILPVGKEITAIGICKLQDGILSIKPSDKLPCFLSDMTKDEVEADLALSTNILFWGGVLIGGLSVGVLVYSILRNWWRWKRWRDGRRYGHDSSDATSEDNAAEDSDELGDIPDGQLCVICLTRRRRSAFTPCGHLVCCPRCAMVVERESSPKCPLCRQSIWSSIRIYAS